MPVVFIWQRDSNLEFFPSGDERIIECLAHVGEAFLNVNTGMDLLDGFLSLRQDPF
jgi:hypothetical protein